jgi:hypothetical protein
MNAARSVKSNLSLYFTRFVATILFAASTLFVLGCENPTSLISMVMHSPFSIFKNGESAASSQDDSESDNSRAADELVKDWEKPDLTLFVTGRLHGYIEPCGCTGLTNQKGGLLRRHTCQKMLQAKGWDPVSIDAGNMIRRFGQQPAIKLKTAYKSISKIMKYDAIGMGVDDMKVSGGDMLLSIEEAKQEGAPTPFTSANMSLFDDPSYIKPFQIVEKNGKKIGVLSAVGAEHIKKAMAAGANDAFTLQMPEVAIARVIRNPQFAACDVKVLLIQSEPENCKLLAAKFPVFDLVVTAGGAGDPTLQPEAIQTRTGHVSQMIQCGVKGMYVGVVGVDFAADGSKAIKYQRVALDASFEDSPPVKQVFLDYQNELKTLWEGGDLQDIKPRLHPSGHKFVGSEACRDCHEEEYDIWLEGHEGDGGPHAKATADLTDPGERTWVKRHFDPECVSCHVTGWNAKNYYPYETGYTDLKKDVLLHGNGCENCHGPGSGHIAAEDGVDDALKEKLRLEVRVTIKEAKARTCYECHDLDNSPDYAEAEGDAGWEKYWPTIEHGGE